MMLKPLLKQAKVRRLIARCLISASFCIVHYGWAEVSENEDKLPIVIHSKRAEFDDKTNEFTYRGAVIAKQGKRTLRADTLIIHENKNHQVDKILAFGKPAHFEAFMPDKPPVNGQAQTIEYFPNENKIVFLNNATLEQTPYAIAGSRLVYLLDSHNLFSESPTEGSENQIRTRTQITVEPHKKEVI